MVELTTETTVDSASDGQGAAVGRALVLRKVGDEPAVEAVETAPPRAGEVRVRVVASGICGSDLHVLDGRSEAMTLPVVMGHEGAGVVEAVGPGVTSVVAGDHVVLGA